MIPNGRFRAQLNTVEKILSKLELLEERMNFPNKTLGVGFFRGKTYRQIYNDCLREFSYDFRLTDQSLLLFLKGGNDQHSGELCFSFYESPVDLMSYREFIASELDISSLHEEVDKAIAVFGDELKSDYEEYISTLNTKNHVTPIRYDYKPMHYQQGCHPASHVHFGLDNQIRVNTERIMNPISFLLMILRQRYPGQWNILLQQPRIRIWVRNVRDTLDEVDARYRNQKDQFELTLR